MKSFFKTVLATIVGFGIVTVTSFIALCLFGLLFIGAIAKSSHQVFALKDNSVLSLDLEGTLLDRVSEPNPFYKALRQNRVEEQGLDDILSAIKKAKENPKIKGIYIEAGIFSASTASLQEIRDALVDFKKSNKFIVAYANDYTQGCYFVASLADKVVMNPRGSFDLHGISVSPTFYKGLLDKLGIQIQIFKVGTYKSAVEPYFLTEMSPANRVQVNSFISDIWGTILAQISNSRNISVKKLNVLTDSLPMFRDPKLIVQQGLVDTLMYETEMTKYVNNILGKDKDSKIQFASVDNMRNVKPLAKNTASDRIAVLYAQGDIVSGSGSEQIEDEYYIDQIEKLRKDDQVKAVVFRVNSPGGSAYAAEQIWKAITDLKESGKPVVVSMGDYAASGGYYISCNATKIIAEPTTLTGSIGIFGMIPNFEGLTEKVGLTFDNAKTNLHSDFGSLTRPMTDDEKIILQNYINSGYDLFLSRCAEGRNIKKDSLNLIAQGRVWTGTQALKLGLIDGIGGIDDAIKQAAVLAKLDTYRVHSYPKKKSFIEKFLNTNKQSFETKIMKEYLGDDYKMLTRIKQIKELKGQDRIQARLPYDFQLQ